MSKWLSVVGVGDEGLTSLSQVALSHLEQARVIFGGVRHLSMLPSDDRRRMIPWDTPIAESIAQLLAHRGQSVCVLATGDPMCFGIGSVLCRHIPISEMTIIPASSAFSLACARLGWSLSDTELVSLCGRDPALLHAVLYPAARILVLSADGQTPSIVANMLKHKGYGESLITILEHLGSGKERILSSRINTWQDQKFADLNTIALECAPLAPGLSRTSGLPDGTYHHDGQLTKREVRAITLSTLAPLPGQLLWDVGAGCGSIGIEWLRSHPRCQAIAIEQQPDRLQLIAENAAALGVPHLSRVLGQAPDVLIGLPQPDAIFIGGGLTHPGVFEGCWQALKPGGRLVANSVTVETEYKLLQLHGQYRGDLSRIAIQRSEPVGQFLGWKAFAAITQWSVSKV